MRFFFLLFFFLSSFLPIPINAQITITAGGTATSIINTFVSNGIVVTNPIINCGSTSYGSYSGNLQAGGIGLSNGGIILTTGSAVGADGPNNSTLSGIDVVGYDYVDPQLTTQPGAGTPPPQLDNCRVEFDMTPICSSFNIAFVFGSEEYPEYVTGAYNDGFGIFVSGPNPLGGNYTSYNMARLPNGQLVSIDNVNSNLNNSYYNTNSTGVMQYDGYTDGLTAQLAVIPCSTYHIKIIIADAGDQLWDSGIFLGAGSFACSMPALSITASPTTICAGASTTLTASTAATGGTYLWSPGGATTQSITVNPSTTTTYTCSYTFSSCSVITATTTVTVATITPSFQPIGPYCSGATIPVFSTSSTNGISGTWSPAVSNTATTTYTFTPTAGQCATTTTRIITVTPNVTPTFAAVAAICSGATAPVLPTSSTNTTAITGTWSPAVSNTATTTYTFTPTAGQCATTTTRIITVTPNVTPTFASVAAICSGATAPVLPTSSTNTPAITGTWSPAVSNTATTTYTFTPTAGQCATTTTRIITVTPNVTPTFAAVAAICSGATAPVLPTSSTNTPAITGTWSPAVSNTATTTYTFTPTAGQCATTTTRIITVTPNVTPTFAAVAAICSGATAPVLPTSSTNTPAITGTWSPAVSNTATTTYTFTPTAGQCATTTTRIITVTPNVTPTFAAVAAICSGATAPVLPTSSTNTPAITGTWSPAVSNTATTTYTFTPTAGQCATTTTRIITVTPNVTPTFAAVAAICSGATAPVLPTSSTNTPAITGTWSPAVSNTATTTYTFTPTAGQCATTTTRIITVTPNVTPTFAAVAAICSGATAPVLPTSSTNTTAITGTWSPAVSNTATTTYTFTPTAGQCATTTTRIITVTPNVTPTFAAVAAICSGATAPVLPTSSTNTPAITGTWSPAVSNTATTTYTFTPTAGQCATTTTRIITVTPNVTPTFAAVAAICSGATAPVLPTSSTNTPAITGTWSPAVSNTATTTYTFTPTAGQCATTTTRIITVTPNVTPTFAAVAAICSGATAPVLPTSSTNTPAITGTWSPAVSNTATTTYTFTPTAGQCATTTTRIITVTPNVTPTFASVAAICSGATAPVLPTSSTNTPAITGTWSPAVSNTATTTYTFTPTAGQCATTTTRIITVTPNVTPTFASVAAICSGATAPVLPTSSTNTPAITGTWSPAVSNTATTTYTFTPTAGQCATTTTRIITVTPNVTPTFAAVAAICSGATAPVLPTSSTNTPAITGTWSPAVSNTATTTYTFTPTAGQCATTTTRIITVTPNVTPTFAAVTAICSGATAPVLPTSSTNTPAITGTWSPAVSNTATTTYTFTPTAGQCATTTTRIITVTPNVTPTFAAVAAICSGATAPVLPTSSTNTPAITGTWSPAVSNTATTTYTFTPTAGQCATTTTRIITVTPNVTPTFAAVAAICSGATAPVLPTSSTNTPAITGTWSPAVSNTATTTYTFTPTAGQCATTTTRIITVTPNVTPTFAAVAAICSGATAPVLPTSSTNTTAITGTWSPAVSNTATTTYTFTPTAGQCATTTTRIITVTPNVTPTFAAVAAICSGATAPVLPTSSTNTTAITGTWSPAVSNTATTTYTFTPTAGQCATTTTRIITVTPNVTPTFAAVAAICSGATVSPLPTSSTNGISGTWTPAINNLTTTTYTFTPTAGQCATTQTMSITITPNTIPSFSQVGPYCPGTTIPSLPTNSINGISGTWSPAINNTATTTYTFTPTAGLCATTQTMSIVISQNTTPTFTQVGPFCSGSSISALPTSSTNGISGTWSPAINNSATTTYTFTPDAGLCGTTQTMNIVISQNTTPTFSQVGPFCSGVTISPLPISSTNGISGTWSPAINNSATTTYTFTPTTGICATTQTINIAITQSILPNFMQVGPFCSGATVSPLPTSSTNGISGTWSPAINNLATTTYTFTPTAGLCAITQTMSITITPNTIPSFSQVGPYCPGTTIPSLPTNSINGISGTWSPAINNTATTTYTFTPTAGLCATTQTMSITISLPILPSFTQVGPFCIGNTISALPTSSTNGISGTWSPAINNSATTTYTFTPTTGICATTQTMNIVISQNTTPTFSQVGPFCSGVTISPLPISSTNGISGTWTPAINNSATTTYTFTPTTGICATTQTMSIAITLSILPSFTQVGPFCIGNTISALPTSSTNGISGTWTPAINNLATTTYTFTPTAGQCATTQTMSITITPNTIPSFSQVGPYCPGTTIPSLPTNSINGISGTWSPAINNTATTTYTFTPTAGLCAITQTMSITISLPILPSFTQVGPFCIGNTISALPTSSTNGISGTWSPAINNSATTTYTFTPTTGICATTQTMNIVISQNTTPTFSQVGPFCSGVTISPLPISSTNGISGTWSPAINNSATTTYTFTPTTGICATTQTINIAITQSILPNFMQVGPFCSGATVSPLPTSSTNGISGTWTPAINNLATTTYTFTPTAGLCATTQTMSITITPNTIPSFSQVGPYCPGTTIPSLPTNSINGISGTWSPAINNTATTTYTFTPTAGLCAITQTMSITISLPILPSFTQVGPFCIGNTISALPTSSTNGISGTWSPAINNSATTTYTFTPTTGICATTQTMNIVISQNTTPTFSQVGPFCSGVTISPLPISSTNGISGTWSPAINNSATTTYTFTPTTGICATTQTMSIAITQSILPNFMQVGPFCSGATISPLPTSSTNGITGTWSPAINNAETTTYTFTPTAGLCAITQTMSITITPNTIPSFSQVGPYCPGTTIPSLPTNSINGISGTWSPAINNTATTTYTFTPTAGLCATTQTMSITISLPILPSFTQVGPFCIGNTISALPTSSTNGISGTWSPAINNSATTTYTFTPTTGICATTQTMNIVISQNTTPTFSQVGPFCSGVTISPLPISSTNGISGTWSPAINNSATTTYTFTPTTGICATTQTINIAITQSILPNFMQVGPFCSGATISPLPTSSTNGITGTWSPAINNAATTTYTFSPTLITGECASTQTMSIIISPIITSTRSEVVCISELPFLWNGISYNGAGIYSYYTVTAGGCDSTAILNLSISPTPLTSFIPSISLFTESPQLVAFTNTSVGAATYSWDFGDGAFSSEVNPEYLFANNSNGQTISLLAVSSEGCIGTYQVSIEFEEGLIFYIPNTFTPDQDEHNQTFRPIFTSGFDPNNYEMLIYNRWGEIIFETHDVTYGWDGTYSFTNSTCQVGVYSYKITFKNLILNERKVVCGNIILLK